MTGLGPDAPSGPDDRPVVKLRSPADICEAVPYLVGFEPADSIVVLSLRGQRKRAGLTARIDLPEVFAATAVADTVTDHLKRDGASAAIVVAYADGVDPGPGSAGASAEVAVHAMIDACSRRGIAVAEALRVADGRWTSYSCSSACCPPSGTPLRDRLAAPGAYAVAMTAEGRQVLTGRAALERSIAPVTGLLADAMRDRLEGELEIFLAAVRSSRTVAYGDATVRLVRACAERLARGEALTVDDAARMLVGLLDRGVRDRCLGGGMAVLSPDDPPLNGAELELWRELVRRAMLPGTAAPAATLLAATAYLDHGNGALANVALDRALADQPNYVMATYLAALLEGGIAPSAVRRWLRDPGSAAEGAPSGDGVEDLDDTG